MILLLVKTKIVSQLAGCVPAFCRALCLLLVGVRPAAVLLFANCRRCVCDTKKQKAVFPLPDVFRFGLDAKIHSTLTTPCISRILILYIYSKFIGSRDKKAKYKP